MSLTTPHDIPLLITVPADTASTAKPLLSAERRITPTWTISQLKSKLEPVTGIPGTSQTLRTRTLDGAFITLQPDTALVGDRQFNLSKGSEIEVLDGRPAGSRLRFDDAALQSVEKYVMPESKYESLDDSVLAWKKRQGLGRFDPNAKGLEEVVEERRAKDKGEVEGRGLELG